MAKTPLGDDEINRPIESNEIKPAEKVVPEYKPPAAHKPGIDWDGLDPEITSEIIEGPLPNYNEVIRGWGFDPEYYEAAESVKVSQWNAIHDGEVKTFTSYKGAVRQKKTADPYNYDDLVKEIKRHRKLSPNLPGGEKTFLVCLADWQLAKADGDGTRGTVNRILKMIDDVESRIRELRKIDRDLGVLMISGLGDIMEGCDGNYASQVFNVELNQRQQLRVARRLVRDAICRWAKLFRDVIVLAVPGNHGENRKDGKMFTTPGDNHDVTIFENVAEILAANEDAYGHVKFLIPEDETSMTIETSGIRVGFTHGHLTTGGGTPQQKIERWWKDQAFAGTAIGSARVLFTGHYHHFSIIEHNEKVHIQCPSEEDISQWWVDLTGENSRPGTLTCVLDEYGYSDLQIV
jgi:predicted phosphodiesterase